MSDETIGSSQQDAVEPEHRTPDLMDNDPCLDRLMVLHEETKSDDEDQDDGQPGTSEPIKKIRVPVQMAKPKEEYQMHIQSKDQSPGRFLWVWMLGFKTPSLVINGEPNLPVAVLKRALELFEESNGKATGVREPEGRSDADALSSVLLNKNVLYRLGNVNQYNAIMEKCDTFRQLNKTELELVSRSDIERIMGEIRIESCATKSEHDDWNPKHRVHIVHVNFVDYNKEWLESDDLEEDPLESGVHGYWFKNRTTMRCIICRECHKRFTPNDFIVHHHHQRKQHGIVHIGLNPAKWMDVIEIHSEDKTEENLTAWRKFSMNSHRIGKRAYDDAEPIEPKKILVEKPIIVDDEDDDVEMEEEGEEIVVKKPDPFTRVNPTGKKLHLADFLGPSGSKGLVPKDDFEEAIIEALKKMDEKTLELLFLRPPEEFFQWLHECEFMKKVVEQQEKWKKLQSDPRSRLRTAANFDPKKGKFENMHLFASASKATQKEIKQLEEKFAKLHKEMKEMKNSNGLDYVIKEQSLLFNSSPEVIRILSNKPLPPKPRPPPLIIKPKAIQPTPISLPNINFMQLAQQLFPSGIKFPLPLPQLISPAPSTVASTPAPASVPATPVLPLPTLPTLPISSNFEILKQQLTLALASPNPALLPIFLPKVPPAAFENLFNLLKTTAVKN